MPPSCLVPAAAGHHPDPADPADGVEQSIAGAGIDGLFGAGEAVLAEYLGRVVDHRSRRGRRYELGFLLALVTAATACAGHDEVAAQAQWAADAPAWVLSALGGRTDPLTGSVRAPSEATLRRALANLDATDLQRVSCQWLAAVRTGKPNHLRLPAVAIDGKSVRGAAAGGHTRPHLLAAATHDGAIVIAQRQIPDKGSEIGELAGLVTGMDLRGVAVTVDALHTQRATAEHLVDVAGADYVMTIKANQPRLLAAAQRALSGPATGFTECREDARGHGRTEQRILRTRTVTAELATDTGIDFPHAAQLFRVTRHVGGLDGQRRTKEIAYGITSLTPDRATAPDLGMLLRGHWAAIENKTHWVRDTTFNEDASTLRSGTAPRAMAIIRNTIIAAFRLTGWHNLKQARRHYAHAFSRCLSLITEPLKPDKRQT